jgi:transcriptional regulator with XRE-family HTH domain
MSIGDNIKRLRRDKRLTQGELATKSNLGLNLISRLERDATDPKLSSLYKLMNALECTADALISDEGVSSMPTLLKTQFERITVLPEDDQRVIIKLIDNYSKAIAYDSITKDRGLFSMQPIMGKTENVLK